MVKRVVFCLLFTLIPLSFSNRALAAEGVWETVLNNTIITSLEVTPWGIFAGEKDTRLVGKGTGNGLFKSTDAGVTWVRSGLLDHGVEDIKYYDRKIYVATYYQEADGQALFYSSDYGNTWEHAGPTFAASAVSRDAKTIYLGGYSHGLWVSQDEGATWVQKIGKGWYGEKVNSIESYEDVTFASVALNVYRSTDNGNTWSLVPELTNLAVTNFTRYKDTIVAAPSTIGTSIHRSIDRGGTWETIELNNGYTNGDVMFLNSNLYAGLRINGVRGLYKSSDFGYSWESTNYPVSDSSTTKDIINMYAGLPIMLVAQTNHSLARYEIPEGFAQNRFLDFPWRTNSSSDAIYQITSYFDHSFPLAGYTYYSEPQNERLTTVNFRGTRDKEPNMYYSSHDGYDFALTFGTEILAPYGGTAYYYYCSDCGHTIKIDHQNGYLTTYMHLQEGGLVTKSTQGVSINKGAVIGKVGMTGNTTGPHLHFTVTQDANNNGTFSDDVPSGKTDPFGFQNFFLSDPWNGYAWSDQRGSHIGAESRYLWLADIPGSEAFLSIASTQVTLDNKVVQINPQEGNENLTLSIRPGFKPDPNATSPLLKYLEHTSFSIEAVNLLGYTVEGLVSPATILINFAELGMENIAVETLSLYYRDPLSAEWIKVPTIVNSLHNFLIAETSHFSDFAVFGEKLDIEPPVTEIQYDGSVVTLTSEGQIFYAYDETEDWNIYSLPLRPPENAITIKYRSMDKNGNLEPVKMFYLDKSENEPPLWHTTSIKNSVFTLHL